MLTNRDIPSMRVMARHALPHLIEATLIPLVLFYGFLWTVGTWGALASAAGWSWVAVLRRLAIGRRVPGLLILGTFGITARTMVAFATGSSFFYFLQPNLASVAVGAAFLISLPAGRPLAARLAEDFVPLPVEALRDPGLGRVFTRITLLWAFVNLASAGVTIVLLITQPMAIYVAAKTLWSMLALAAGVAISTMWFRRAVRPV